MVCYSPSWVAFPLLPLDCFPVLEKNKVIGDAVFAASVLQISFL
jgi:hypothetical protein